jgi:hypothetical protein
MILSIGKDAWRHTGDVEVIHGSPGYDCGLSPSFNPEDRDSPPPKVPSGERTPRGPS